MYTYCFNNPIIFYDPTGHVVTKWDKDNLSKTEIELLKKLTNDYETAQKAFALANNKNYWSYKLLNIHQKAEDIRDGARFGKGLIGTRDGNTRPYNSYKEAYNDILRLKRSNFLYDPLDRVDFNTKIVDQWLNNVDSLDHKGKIIDYGLTTVGHYDDATGEMVYSYIQDDYYYRAIIIEATGQYNTIFNGIGQQFLANGSRIGGQFAYNRMVSTVQSGLSSYNASFSAPKPAKVNGTYQNNLEELEGTGVYRNTTREISKGTSRLEYLRSKYGQLTTKDIHQRINLRGEVRAEYDRLIASGVSKKEIGPAVGGIMHKETGRTFIRYNTRDGSIPDNINESLNLRNKTMPQDIYDEYREMTLGSGSHAEVLAYSDAKNEYPDANPSDFWGYVIKTRGKSLGQPFVRCPHCEYLTDGVDFFPEVIWFGKDKGRIPYGQR